MYSMYYGILMCLDHQPFTTGLSISGVGEHLFLVGLCVCVCVKDATSTRDLWPVRVIANLWNDG